MSVSYEKRKKARRKERETADPEIKKARIARKKARKKAL